MIGFNTRDDANDNINDSNDKVIPIIASTIMLMEITKKMIMTLIIWIIYNRENHNNSINNDNKDNNNVSDNDDRPRTNKQ